MLPAAGMMVNDNLHLVPLTNPSRWGEMLATLEPWKTLGSTPGGLTTYLAKDDAALFRYAIQYQGEEAGVVCLRHPWLRGPFLELFAMAPNFQHRRLGTMVVAGLCNQIAPWSNNFWVTVSEFNLAAKTFYCKLGFQQVATLPGLIHADYSDLLLRRHPLRSNKHLIEGQ